MKWIFSIQTLIIVTVVLLPILLHAQSEPGSDPDYAPIDGGLSLLIAGGIGYGGKKVKNNRNKS